MGMRLATGISLGKARVGFCQSVPRLSLRERWGTHCMMLATRWILRNMRFALTLFILSLLLSCNRSSPNHVEIPPPAQSQEAATKTEEKPVEPQAPIVLPSEPDHSARWLIASNPREGAKGGWVEGSFDPKRNHIDIRTKDIERFDLDTGRLPIDWNKLVVIEIDGKSAELRKRENPVIEFEPDGAGHWKVKE